MPDKDDRKFDERDLVFRYSRERRMDSASETVRKLNEEGPKRRFNLIKPLTATKPLTFLFISIVLLSVMVYFISFISGSRDETAFGGNTIKISAFTFEGKTYVTVNKKIKNKNSHYLGMVDLAFSPKEDRKEQDPNKIEVKTERIFFTSEPEEDFKMALPFETEQLVILMQSEKEIQKLNVKTK